MVIPSEEERVCEDEMVKPEQAENEQVQTPNVLAQGGNTEEEHITLHALSGHSANNTIRVKGVVNNRSLNILIDSGSTGNYLDPRAAKRLGLKLEDTKPMLVSVVDGFKVPSTQICRQMKWSTQESEFCTEMRVYL